MHEIEFGCQQKRKPNHHMTNSSCRRKVKLRRSKTQTYKLQVGHSKTCKGKNIPKRLWIGLYKEICELNAATEKLKDVQIINQQMRQVTLRYQVEEDQLLCHQQTLLSEYFLLCEDLAQYWLNWVHGSLKAIPLEELTAPPEMSCLKDEKMNYFKKKKNREEKALKVSRQTMIKDMRSISSVL